MDENKVMMNEIEEVKELNDFEKVNKLLKTGWILLSIIQEARFYHEGNDYSRPVYVLGKKRS